MKHLHVLQCLVYLSVLISCQRNDRLDKEEKETQDDRAEHNAGLASGVGNVYIAGSLRPNVLCQEFGFLRFGADTLTYFGATDGGAALTDVNMMVYSDRGNDAYFLVQFDVEQGLMRHSAIVGNGLSS